MQVILLAAGQATRLKPLTDELPKCLLEIGGRTILSRAVGALVESGLRKFTVVDGFMGHLIREALTAEFSADLFTFVRNEAFASTNNAYSLMLARYPLDEPMFLLDSDIVFDPEVIATLLADPHDNRLALRTAGEWGAEDIKVTTDPDGRIRDIGKQIEPGAAAGESVGLEIFSAEFARGLFATLERRMLREERINEWYEASFVERIEAGEAVHAVDLGDRRSMEIDTLEDLEQARRLFPA